MSCRGGFFVPSEAMDEMTHQNSDGSLKMVNVGDKDVTARRAVATGTIQLKSALEPVRDDRLKKGSALECARLAGIMAAKKTSDLIPLCHQVELSGIDIDFEFTADRLTVTATAETCHRTGVEMEALTAVSVALLTVYDMAKAIEKGMIIDGVRLLEKSGGRSGDFRAEA